MSYPAEAPTAEPTQAERDLHASQFREGHLKSQLLVERTRTQAANAHANNHFHTIQRLRAELAYVTAELAELRGEVDA